MQRTTLIVGASLVLLVSVGCDKADDGDTAGDGSTTSGDGDGESETGDGEGETGDGDGDGDPIMCPDQFPSFDKSCVDVGECVIALHQTNCCGTLAAIGINVAEQAAFEAAEAICESQYPGCGCAAGPTTAEDGNSSTDDTAIVVDCVEGSCTTLVP
jgi:hypothetical protein